MTFERIAKAMVLVAGAGFIFVGVHGTKARAQGRGSGLMEELQDNDQALALIGIRIAPDFVKLNGRNPTLFGLGSYIVNVQSDCNGCHTSDPANEFLPTNNPFWLPPNNYPRQFNQAVYLNGGQNFGPVGPGVVKNAASPLYAGPGLGPNIITRNLTPDNTGFPEGGNSLATFMMIMRTGHDADKLHQNCGGGVVDNCYNAPVNGAVLQVMPWPAFQNMTDYQLTAIWTYLKAVPCNAHNDALGTAFPWLQNACQ